MICIDYLTIDFKNQWIIDYLTIDFKWFVSIT